MSTLKLIEKKIFEDLFGMSSGHVLDFTNATFAEFFRTTVQIDIYSPKYSVNGESKAKRLRAFWELEPDPLVGRVLSELLDFWRLEKLPADAVGHDKRYVEARNAVERLFGKKPPEKPSEKVFLEKKFGETDLSRLPIDSTLLPVLRSRISEAELCMSAGAPLAAIFLCGSVLEGILLGLAISKPQAFNTASASPKDRDGRVRKFQDWSLAQLIDVASELSLLRLEVKKFGHGLRDFRNYIHPYEQLTSKFDPDMHTAKICMQVLRVAIVGLTKQ